MDRIWRWAWDRYGARYSWAITVVGLPIQLSIWLFASFVVVAFEKSDRYVEAAAVTVVAVLVMEYGYFLPGVGRIRLVERWAAGREVDLERHWPPRIPTADRRFSELCRSTLLGRRCYWLLSAVS